MITGYKRFYEGASAGEVYTKLGASDYAAEIAQIRASGADSVFFFLPGGMGIAFLKQYAQSGLDIPLVGPAFSFDQGILQAVGEAALGVKNTSQWSKDIDQSDQQGLRRELSGRIWPPALALCEPGLRHGQPAGLRGEDGERRRCRCLPRGAGGGRLRVHARRLLVRAEPSPGAGHLRPRSDPGRRHLHQQDRRRGHEEPRQRLYRRLQHVACTKRRNGPPRAARSLLGPTSVVSRNSRRTIPASPSRHGRACPGHPSGPRSRTARRDARIPGTSPGRSGHDGVKSALLMRISRTGH